MQVINENDNYLLKIHKELNKLYDKQIIYNNFYVAEFNL